MNDQSIIESFKILSNSKYLGVEGVYCFDSQVGGPTVGIGVMTHGNEPSGLAAFKYIYERNIIPTRGKIIFILNNLKAAQMYFENISDSIEEKRKYRWVDINMNRLPKECMSIDSEVYEINRVKQLNTVYNELDFGLDIHSAESDPQSTIINISDDLNSNLFQGFPIEINKVIANMATIQSGIPACKLFGGLDRNIPILGIETGTHEDIESFETSVDCVIQFCKNCGIIDRSKEVLPRKFHIYTVVKSILYPKDDYYVPQKFLAFEKLTKGQILGINDHNETVTCPFDCLTLFGKEKLQKPKNITDEVFFLLDYPKEIIL